MTFISTGMGQIKRGQCSFFHGGKTRFTKFW